MIWPLSHTWCSIIVINFCIRYACPIVICDTAVGTSCRAPPTPPLWACRPIRCDHVIWTVKCLSCHSSRGIIILLLYFFFPHPYWTSWVDRLLHMSATISHHKLKGCCAIVDPTEPAATQGKPALDFHHRNVGSLVSCQLKSIVCQVPCGYLQESSRSKTKVLFWPHHQQTDLTLPDYNNEGSPGEDAQPHCTSHRITTLPTHSWPQPHFFRQMHA